MRAASLPCLTVVYALMLSPARLSAQAAGGDSMAEHAHGTSMPSSSLILSVDGSATTLSVAELAAMPQKTVTVHNEHTKADETYSGVMLGDLLAAHGFPIDKTTHRKMLRSYVIAEGTDGYRVLYSVIEIEPSEHNAVVMVAVGLNGKPLGDDGRLKLIDSADRRPERWVRNLSAISLKSAE